MKLKKWMAGMLAVCMVASAATTAALAADPVVPQVTLETKITGDTTLEIGLNVRATGFKSVGTVLEYDKSFLRPASWVEGATVTVPGVDVSTAGAWSSYGVVPTKGSDSTAAKPAMAFTDSGTNGKGYIYIGADSFGGVDVTDRVVTVRFELVPENAIKKLTPENVTVGGADAKIAFAALPAVTIGMIDDNIVLSVIGESGTVRYSNKTLTVGDTGYVKLAPGNDTTGGGGGGTTGDNQEWVTPGEGPGVSTSTGGGLAVTFVDWDGSLLDTAALPEEKAEAATALAAMIAEGGSLHNALTTKTGYAFDCWLNYTKMETDAAAGTAVPFTSNATSIKTTATTYVVPESDLPSKANATSKGLTLQAAYVEAGCVTDGEYTFSKAFGKDGLYCTRFGGATEDSGKYSITLDMDRGNLRRAVSPGLRIAMNPKDGQPIFSFQRAASADTITFEVVPTRDMANLSIELVDTYGANTWITAKCVSGSVENGTIDMGEVIKYGTANFIMEQAIQKQKGNNFDWDENVRVAEFTDAGFTNVNDGNLAAAKAAVLSKYTASSTDVNTYDEFAGWIRAIG